MRQFNIRQVDNLIYRSLLQKYHVEVLGGYNCSQTSASPCFNCNSSYFSIIKHVLSARVQIGPCQNESLVHCGWVSQMLGAPESLLLRMAAPGVVLSPTSDPAALSRWVWGSGLSAALPGVCKSSLPGYWSQVHCRASWTPWKVTLTKKE